MHFLAGGAHESIGTGAGLVITTGPTQNAFATTLGGGLDLKVLPFISLRPIQIDYLLAHFNSNTQNQPRISAGILLRFSGDSETNTGEASSIDVEPKVSERELGEKATACTVGFCEKFGRP